MNFDIASYGSFEELKRDVKNQFVIDGVKYPDQADPYLRDAWLSVANPEYAYAVEKAQMRLEEKKQIANMLGNGEIMTSLSDEILDDLRTPQSEIMDIDMTQYATTHETVVPPEIQKFIYPKPSFFGRIVDRFRKFFSR